MYCVYTHVLVAGTVVCTCEGSVLPSDCVVAMFSIADLKLVCQGSTLHPAFSAGALRFSC
jgi:hypothetical protein